MGSPVEKPNSHPFRSSRQVGYFFLPKEQRVFEEEKIQKEVRKKAEARGTMGNLSVTPCHIWSLIDPFKKVNPG